MPEYSASSYDDHFCLKPPLLLWVVTLYLSRAISLPLAIGMGHFAGASADTTHFFQDLINIYTVLPSVLAAAVLYAMFRRQPSASAGVRRIWAHGRGLLAAAAIIDCGVSIYTIGRDGDLNDQSLPALLGIVLDLYFLVYILAARRVRDTFAAFPVPIPSSRPV